MKFDYKGKKYNTYSAKNKLDEITSEDFQEKFIREWFDDSDFVMKNSKLQLAYALALMSAKYEDIISNLSPYSVAGTYPEWVVDDAYGADDDE